MNCSGIAPAWDGPVLYGRCDWAAGMWDDKALVAAVAAELPGFQPYANQCGYTAQRACTAPGSADAQCL